MFLLQGCFDPILKTLRKHTCTVGGVAAGVGLLEVKVQNHPNHKMAFSRCGFGWVWSKWKMATGSTCWELIGLVSLTRTTGGYKSTNHIFDSPAPQIAAMIVSMYLFSHLDEKVSWSSSSQPAEAVDPDAVLCFAATYLTFPVEV